MVKTWGYNNFTTIFQQDFIFRISEVTKALNFENSLKIIKGKPQGVDEAMRSIVSGSTLVACCILKGLFSVLHI